MSRGLLVLPAVENIEEIYCGVSSTLALTRGFFSQVQFIFKDGGLEILHDGVDLKDFDSVWLSSFWQSRDLAYAVSLYLTHHGVSHTYVESTSSKITDQINFTIKGIPIPNTFYSNLNKISKYIDAIEDTCGYPLVVKDIRGSKGKYSAIVNDREELIRCFESLPTHKKYFFQSYIANDYDWGVLVADGIVVSGEKSYSMDGEFRNNTCNGATEIFVKNVDIPSEIQRIALLSSGSLDLAWSRPDIIIDKATGKPYLLEVNRLPGITSNSDEVAGAQAFLQMHLDGVQKSVSLD